MKKNISKVFLLFILLGGLKLSAQESFKWKEMNDFHATAMKAFHSAEAGILKPTKDSAAVIVERVKAWQSSVAQAPYDKKEVADLLIQLKMECNAINEAVNAKKSDKVLKSLVMKAHDTFHAILAKGR